MRRLHSLSLVAAAFLCFDAVDTDCHGGPETIARYPIVTVALFIVGWTAPTLDAPDPSPIYASGPGPSVPDVPPFVGRGCAVIDADPPLGGVYLYRPEAQDESGNRSDDPCL